MQPTRYTLHLEPDLTTFRFAGVVRIAFAAPAERGVALDAVDLEVTACSLVGSSPRELSWSHADGVLRVDLPADVAGEIEIEIAYRGEINDLMAGFYRSRYYHDGETRYLAVTQFEERDARRAFPCVDEPGAKAEFRIEIAAAAGHLAIANTPVEQTVDLPDGRRLYRFEPSPPMSTYLVFFAVGPFDVETDDSWRVPIRVAVSPGKGHEARGSLEYARKSIAYLEELVGVEYPLGKLDTIGVTDFAFGAMENFGAISYRENLLLTTDSTTRREVESMMGVAAHEVAHMWFGDLVSPASWRFVWLNEAFATYFGNLTVEHWYPQWLTIPRLASGSATATMGRDALPGTVPIELEADEIEIDPSTAPIVYQKGAAVLRMIHAFYGDAAFRAATSDFLSDFSFAAVDTEGFLRSFGGALDRHGSIPLASGSAADMLERWIRQPGFPVLRVARRDGGLEVRQERFSAIATTGTGAAARAETWRIPVTGRLESGASLDFVLDGAGREVDVPATETWVKLNRDQSGYYRVFYEEPAAWDALGRAAQAGALSALDRSGLVSDLAAFTWAGLVDLERFLRFLRGYYASERDPIVVSAIADELAGFAALLPGSEPVRSAGLALLRPHLDELLREPSETEPYGSVVMRDPVLWALYLFGEPAVAARLRELARDYRDGAHVHADLTPLALRVGVADEPGYAAWVRDEASRPGIPEAKLLKLIGSLSAVRDEAEVAPTLEYINSAPYRNRLSFLRPAGANAVLYPRLWDWFTANFASISAIHPYHVASTITSVVPTGGLGREQEVTAFLDDYLAGTPAIDRGVVVMALERLEANRRFLEREA